ncbi:MAG: PAS domain S-box protein [Hydrogenophaga sp.]|jgi:PAS domain S-box-containing protein|nr:PAS domain S-box protein [Hydrogenophaga sp.]
MNRPTPAAESPVDLDEIPFQGIVEAALAGVYVVHDERFRYVNGTFAAMFGYAIAEMDGMHMRDLVTLDSGDDVMEKYRQRISGETPSIRYTTKCRHKDGHTVYLEIDGARVLFRGQPALSGMAIDITERVARQQELLRSREQLHQLAQHINTVREEQRADFARDVHDVLGGMLTSIKMDVTRIQRRAVNSDLHEILTITDDLLSLTQETIDAVRRIADEARPRSLDSLGLFAALHEMLVAFGERSGMAVSFHLDGSEPPLSSHCSTQCYRIVQEALTNVVRHADARQVRVHVRGRADGFELDMEDDGRGIAADTAKRAGLGLIGMKERAREVGGSLEVAPARTGGTLISLRVPVRPPGARP